MMISKNAAKRLLASTVAVGALFFAAAPAPAQAALSLDNCRGGLTGAYSTDNDIRYWYNISPAGHWVGWEWNTWERTSDWRIEYWVKYTRFDGQRVYKKFICKDENHTGKLASSEDWPVIS